MIYIANWKMHGNPRDIASLNPVIKLSKQKKYRNLKIVYCPPYTLLDLMKNKIKNSKLKLGAQNCHTNSDYGAFTGSINSKMLKFIGAKFVIVGHSENRNFGDSDFSINKKIKSALKENLKVILCIGETLNERRKKITKKVLKKQIENGLSKIKEFNNILFAYEPRWSIGTGLIAKEKDLAKNIKDIKKILISSNKKLKNAKILYGGSVNPINVKEIMKIKDIKGLLIGGASLNSKKFIDIIKKSIN